MSAVNLVILGLLKKNPASAYELALHVEQSRIRKIIKIGSPTIYQNIKKMASRGYLSTTKVREGEMPEKTIYRLTESGEAYFLELMHKFSANPGRMFFPFNSFIKNLTLVDQETGLQMLRDLKLFFYETREDLNNDISAIDSPPFAVEVIMRQYQIMLKGMIEWVDEVIELYRERAERPGSLE
ncbi:PadR family transcriptional regulator [Desulfogranum mediterraneum]|uniref:PadR family transcriptional regulator n=1 Tax=Desulfogranum mediterraneum TaxID=160661 RepID=UPI000407E98F|nr:PadR family transcriptional regulator [Desulfogranum mediterraneum]